MPANSNDISHHCLRFFSWGNENIAMCCFFKKIVKNLIEVKRTLQDLTTTSKPLCSFAHHVTKSPQITSMDPDHAGGKQPFWMQTRCHILGHTYPGSISWLIKRTLISAVWSERQLTNDLSGKPWWALNAVVDSDAAPGATEVIPQTSLHILNVLTGLECAKNLSKVSCFPLVVNKGWHWKQYSSFKRMFSLKQIAAFVEELKYQLMV